MGNKITPHFTIIELEQGTREWLEWRHKGIGASDAPTIMGENPWKRAEELLREKRGPARDSGKNEAMNRGTLLEPEARRCYVARTGNDVRPACLQSNQHVWLHASVDGISANGNAIVEIKCGESVYRHTSQYRCIPDYYYGQLQHILAVSGLASLDFWCYLPGRPELLTPVARTTNTSSTSLLQKGTSGTMSNETSNLHFEATVSKRRFAPPSSGLSCATLGRKIKA